jgi:hypothetical protein
MELCFNTNLLECIRWGVCSHIYKGIIKDMSLNLVRTNSGVKLYNISQVLSPQPPAIKK